MCEIWHTNFTPTQLLNVSESLTDDKWNLFSRPFSRRLFFVHLCYSLLVILPLMGQLTTCQHFCILLLYWSTDQYNNIFPRQKNATYMNTLLCNRAKLPTHMDWVHVTSGRDTELFISMVWMPLKPSPILPSPTSHLASFLWHHRMEKALKLTSQDYCGRPFKIMCLMSRLAQGYPFFNPCRKISNFRCCVSCQAN